MNFESKFEPRLVDRERQAREKSKDFSSPRPEYAQGKEKLNYTYKFSTGEILSATEDEEGIAHIVITKNGSTIFDFNEVASMGIKFVTPSYYIEDEIYQGLDRSRDGAWSSSSQSGEIKVGDMRSPKSIACLLHEIGHIAHFVRNKDIYKYGEPMRFFREYTGLFSKGYKDKRRKFAEAISREERGAWAEALMIARRLKKEKGINLLEGFEDLEDLQDGIYSALLSYKLSIGQEMVIYDEGLLKYVLGWVKDKLGLREENYGAEQWDFLKSIFDKGKLQRKDTKIH